ncbi:MAG TPA: Fe-S-containing protein [Thermoanaerobaculia bacterium]|jgi:uncharacterized membrane protein|nr:Fe-S-containing protein [Thermoanaerobaculia bacterium]
MRRFKPVHGFIVVVVFMAIIWLAQSTLEGRLNPSGFEQVAPDQGGQVRIAIGELGPQEARFFRFLNSGNQEVRFFVGRDSAGHVQVAFDANEECFKAKRGYRHEGEWLVCNKCDKSFRLSTVNSGGGGCTPVPVKHRVEGEQLVLAEADILQGWRFFR